MARGYLGLILVSVFVVVDCILIWIVNSRTGIPGIVGAVPAGDQFTITLVLIGAAVIAILVGIAHKVKPWK